MKITGVAAGALAVIALAGCSSSHTATHKAPSQADNKVAYIATVRGVLGIHDYPDAKLVAIAHRQCQMVRTGSTHDDVVDTMAQTTGATYTHAQLTGWVSAATSTYCPE